VFETVKFSRTTFLEIQDGVKNMELAITYLDFQYLVLQNLTVLNTNQMQKSKRKNIENWPHYQKNYF
jgi:hypothetical protein